MNKEERIGIVKRDLKIFDKGYNQALKDTIKIINSYKSFTNKEMMIEIIKEVQEKKLK